jgi:hypothetical protein
MINPTDLALIAILKDPRDLDVVRLLGWYRIPLRFAPKVVRVDVLAFYQTAEFGAEKWSIRYAARVNGVELVRRLELFQDEENHPRANEEYYKLQLGPLETLPRPIPCGSWKRLTFLYTTGEKLLSAERVSDLALTGSRRDVLWRALRDRAPAAESDGGGNFPWPDALDAVTGWFSAEDGINPERS